MLFKGHLYTKKQQFPYLTFQNELLHGEWLITEFDLQFSSAILSLNSISYPAQGYPGGSVVKNLPAIQEMQVLSLGQEDPLEKGTATYSSFLAWRIPWTEEPGGL